MTFTSFKENILKNFFNLKTIVHNFILQDVQSIIVAPMMKMIVVMIKLDHHIKIGDLMRRKTQLKRWVRTERANL